MTNSLFKPLWPCRISYSQCPETLILSDFAFWTVPCEILERQVSLFFGNYNDQVLTESG